MLKELSIPSIFPVSSKSRLVRASNLRQASAARKVLAVVLASLCAALAFTYILGVNTYASTGYEIKSLQNKVSAAAEQNKKLNLQIAEKTSISNLESELVQSGYTPVKELKYLKGDSQYTIR